MFFKEILLCFKIFLASRNFLTKFFASFFRFFYLRISRIAQDNGGSFNLHSR